MENLDFFRFRRVFVTGHTGFKGSWLCRLLLLAGAEVTGFALPPPPGPALFRLAGLEGAMHSVIGDVRDLDALRAAFDAARPEFVIHLAAQPIVRESYRDPVGTYSANVMGTVHLLECVRRSDSVGSVLVVTTDKVYENAGRRDFRETDPLGGYDPYSGSKACSELVTHSYRRSFLSGRGIAVSTARAGNVIGGGDFAPDRIMPDCIRAARAGVPVRLRHPDSLRPYQHVLEPLTAYLELLRRQCGAPELSDSYNVGPDACDCVSTGALAELFCRAWGGVTWEREPAGDSGPHEDAVLTLNCAKIRAALGWRPRWHIARAVEETVAWTKTWLAGGDVPACMDRQIAAFLAEK